MIASRLIVTNSLSHSCSNALSGFAGSGGDMSSEGPVAASPRFPAPTPLVLPATAATPGMTPFPQPSPNPLSTAISTHADLFNPSKRYKSARSLLYMAGTLYKRGNLLRQWVGRYVVFRRNFLYVFNDKNDRQAKEVIFLEGYFIESQVPLNCLPNSSMTNRFVLLQF